MILSVAGLTATGLLSGQDLSGYVDRSQGFSIEAAIGKRIDTSHFTLMDTLPSSIQVPDRAEAVIYDVTNNPQLSYASMILRNLPVAYYRLNDAGAIARDWSGFGNTGTLVGGITTGQAGPLADGSTAMLFNGTTGKITLPSFNISPPFTVAFWAKTTTGAQQPFLSSRGGSGNLYFGIQAGALFAYYNTAGVPATAGGAINNGAWHRCVVVLTTTAVRLYVDGVLVATNTTTVPASGASVCSIGWDSPNGEWFAGTLGEGVLCNYVWDQGQITSDFILAALSVADPQVVDPTWSISAYNTWRNGAGNESTSPTPANWTPRLFGGYVATPKYTHEGPQRYVQIACQDYTTRLRTTVTNMAFAAGNSDQSIVKQLFARYRSDYNTTNVAQILASFPAITYPVHTLEQCMERIIKVTRGYYRADYYKQMWYGVAGQQNAPFNLSDVPNSFPNPVPNPQFDSGFTSWATYSWPGATAATRSIDAAASPPVGTQALKIIYGGTNAWEGESVSVVVPTGTVVFSVYMKGAVGGESVNVYCDDPLNPNATFVLTTAWNRYWFSATGMTGGTRNLYLRIGAGTFWATGVQVEPGIQPGNFNTGGLPTFPTEQLEYTPDGSGLANRVWVIGSTYLSAVQAYQVPPALVNGTAYQFPLPGNPEAVGMTITVGGVDQGKIGVSPGDGDVTTPSSFKYNTLIQHVPATVSFKTPPGAGVAVVVTGQFRYPLVQVVTDAALIAATNGVVFEAIVRDKRINDAALARSVGTTFLKLQGSTLKGGKCITRTRQAGGVLLQPGHVITIKNDVMFRNILKDANGNPTTTAVVIVTQLRTLLDDDTLQPYAIELSFADRHVSGGY